MPRPLMRIPRRCRRLSVAPEALESRCLLTYLPLVEPSGVEPYYIASDVRVVGNRAVFAAQDEFSASTTLWITDGTSPGTAPLAPIGGGFVDPKLGSAIGGSVAFLVESDAGSSGVDLWISDGTPEGTHVVKQNVGSSASPPVAMGGKWFFLSVEFDESLHGQHTLWATDGTPEGTIRIQTFDQARTFSPPPLATIGNRLYFSEDSGGTGSAGFEPWVSDGTPGGATLLKDIRPPDPEKFDSHPSGFTEFAGAVYFLASPAEGQVGLYRTNGTPGGTTLVRGGIGADSFRVENLRLVASGPRLFFQTYAVNADALWTSDGTPDGTLPLTFGPDFGEIASLGDGRAVFSNLDLNHGFEPWISDGTSAGTHLLVDLDPATYQSAGSTFGVGSDPSGFAAVGGLVYFAAHVGNATSAELYQTDGSAGGTKRVADLMPGADDFSPAAVAGPGGSTLVLATAPDQGYRLWADQASDNHFPALPLPPFHGIDVAPGESVRLNLAAIDPDAGQSLTYSISFSELPVTPELDTVTGQFSFDVPADLGLVDQIFRVVVHVRDNGSPVLGDVIEIGFHVVIPPDQHPPAFDDVDPLSVRPGKTLRATLVAHDPDPGQTVTYAIEENDAEGATIDPATGELTWSVPAGAELGEYEVVISATDSSPYHLQAFTRLTITVFADGPNRQPELSKIPTQFLKVGEALDITASATDPDGDNLTYDFIGERPAGMTINPDSGRISWTADAASLGKEILVRVSVEDDGAPSLDDSTLFSIVVYTNHDPVITPISPVTIGVGQPLSVDVVATDAEQWQRLTYALGTGAPGGMAIDQGGRITWTPNSAQGPAGYDVTVIARDDDTPAGQSSTSFHINVIPPNQAPKLTLADLATVRAGGGVVTKATAVDPDSPGGPLTFSFGPLPPAGFAIDAVSGVITFAPSVPPGLYSIVVFVTDAGSPPLSDADLMGVAVTPGSSSKPTTVVRSIRPELKNGALSALVLTLDGGFDASSLSARAFSLTGAGGVRFKLKAPRYDAATNTIRLTLRKSQKLAGKVELRASGLRDTQGRAFDGNHDGQPGGDLVAKVTRRRVTIV